MIHYGSITFYVAHDEVTVYERINTDHSPRIFHLHGLFQFLLHISVLSISLSQFLSAWISQQHCPALANLDFSDHPIFCSQTRKHHSSTLQSHSFGSATQLPPPHIGGMNISLLLSPPAIASSTSLLLLLRTLG